MLHETSIQFIKILLGDLTTETIAYLSWRRDRCLTTFGSLKNHVERVLIDPLRFFNSNLYKWPHTLHPFGKSIQVFLFTICPSTTLMKEEILDNHTSVLCSFGISTKDEELDLQSLYWIPKLHKCPFKQSYIAGSYLRWPFFFMKYSWTNSLNLSFSLEWGIVV
jgi:hypothetical protein